MCAYSFSEPVRGGMHELAWHLRTGGRLLGLVSYILHCIYRLKWSTSGLRFERVAVASVNAGTTVILISRAPVKGMTKPPQRVCCISPSNGQCRVHDTCVTVAAFDASAFSLRIFILSVRTHRREPLALIYDISKVIVGDNRIQITLFGFGHPLLYNSWRHSPWPPCHSVFATRNNTLHIILNNCVWCGIYRLSIMMIIVSISDPFAFCLRFSTANMLYEQLNKCKPTNIKTTQPISPAVYAKWGVRALVVAHCKVNGCTEMHLNLASAWRVSTNEQGRCPWHAISQ